ncbi:hypothetical protein GTW25_06810 [Aliihoeflea aestuarii]|jgi:hypothetical protein|nr:hypothetical protein [Aliihoeflea aestuarii]MCO6390736.1 hypothetical protein [Aliihoeflea aestuarii]
MAGKVLSTALLGALVAGSFYFFGSVQAEPQARLALLNPPIEADSSVN